MSNGVRKLLQAEDAGLGHHHESDSLSYIGWAPSGLPIFGVPPSSQVHMWLFLVADEDSGAPWPVAIMVPTPGDGPNNLLPGRLLGPGAT